MRNKLSPSRQNSLLPASGRQGDTKMSNRAWIGLFNAYTTKKEFSWVLGDTRKRSLFKPCNFSPRNFPVIYANRENFKPGATSNSHQFRGPIVRTRLVCREVIPFFFVWCNENEETVFFRVLYGLSWAVLDEAKASTGPDCWWLCGPVTCGNMFIHRMETWKEN